MRSVSIMLLIVLYVQLSHAGEIDLYTDKPLTDFQHFGAGVKRLIVVGDSRVRCTSDKFLAKFTGPVGWGECLGRVESLKDYEIYNCGIAGTSIRSFINRGYWSKVLELVRSGDTVVFYFAGNDMRPVEDLTRSCGEIWGLGNRTITVRNPHLKTDEVVMTYGAYFGRIISDVKRRGGIPLICSYFSGNSWKEGKHDPRFSTTINPWILSIAASNDIKVIDLFAVMESEFEKRGADGCTDLFDHDGFHLSKKGAVLVAELIGGVIIKGAYVEPDKNGSNKALEPATTSVTPAAGAPVAGAGPM